MFSNNVMTVVLLIYSKSREQNLKISRNDVYVLEHLIKVCLKMFPTFCCGMLLELEYSCCKG